MSENIPYGKISSTDELGHLIKQRRKDLSEKQKDIAALCGVGPRFLSELERGKETAEIGKALEVLKRIGLDIWILPRGTKPTGCD
jgi:transcriptional regulator with XRE-family HTH domain